MALKDDLESSGGFREEELLLLLLLVVVVRAGMMPCRVGVALDGSVVATAAATGVGSGTKVAVDERG